MCHVTLSLFRFEGLYNKLWAFSQMGLAKPAIAKMAGLQFFKLMGTGAGAGFSTRPNFGCYTLLCVWQRKADAEAALEKSTVLRRYVQHAEESATLHMAPTQSRGVWSGKAPFDDEYPAQSNPIVALTRASLAPGKAWQFWSRVPAISDAIELEPNMRFMMGMGEVPWLHQVTFSIWDDREAMVRFSRQSATHGEAVRRAYQDGWFKENLFARFNLLKIDGEWNGLISLKRLIADDAKPAQMA